MTEAQYKKADSKVLPVSLIIITGIFLNMIGLITSQGGNVQLYVTTAACVLGAIINIITYVKTKGTKKCGITMIIAALFVCCIMIVCIDTIGYYMIAMATVVMSMAYMYMTITDPDDARNSRTYSYYMDYLSNSEVGILNYDECYDLVADEWVLKTVTAPDGYSYSYTYDFMTTKFSFLDRNNEFYNNYYNWKHSDNEYWFRCI